jgi:hypothetical protein
VAVSVLNGTGGYVAGAGYRRGMAAREEILAAIHRLGRSTFTVMHVVREMERHGTDYAESTIRTHIVSRMCADAPDSHGTTYADLERVDRGTYRLKDRRPSAG